MLRSDDYFRGINLGVKFKIIIFKMKEYKKKKESQSETSSELTALRSQHFVNFVKDIRKIKLK